MSNAVVIEQVTKRYQQFTAVDQLSLTIPQGAFLGLLGPNGAGKSTLIGMMSGLVRPSSGRITIMGHDVVSDCANARRNLGLVPQEIAFDPFFKVKEALSLQLGYMGLPLKPNQAWLDELLYELDLGEKADRRIKTLSGGMKRRVLIAQALVHRPPVVILDEPTAGVDVELRQKMWSLTRRLNEQGHTILLTTHYLEEAEALCDTIAVINRGRLLAVDKKHDLMQQHAGKYLNVWVSEITDLPGDWPRSDGGECLRFAVTAEQSIETILARLQNNGIKVLDIETETPNLEHVFLDITQRAS